MIDAKTPLIPSASSISIAIPPICDPVDSTPSTPRSKSNSHISTQLHRAGVLSSRSDSNYWNDHSKGIDSRLLFFITQVTFSFISLGFGIYSAVSGDKTLGMSLIMYVLGLFTTSPKITSSPKV